jgi:hypothetical protein
MTEWILAFDAACGRCSKIVDKVLVTAGERITMAGLGEDRILSLRRRALGDHPPFAPTLLAVDVDRVRAWTGPRMSVRLAVLLGPKRSVEVVRALNQMDVIVHGDRRRFLKVLPGAALGVFLLSGGAAAPAMAAPGRRSTWAEAAEWVSRLDRLPIGYDELTAQSVVRRRAAFAAMSQEEKADLWKEHIHRFRLARPELSAEESALLDEATLLISDVFGVANTAGHHVDLAQFEKKAFAVLGPENTFAALAMLGPGEPASAAADCWCNVGSSCSCPNGHVCKRVSNCAGSGSGCGCFWIHDCDGNFCQKND